MTDPRITVHILKHGRPVCGFHPGLPKDWPPGHKWVGEEDLKEATCRDCLLALTDERIAEVPETIAKALEDRTYKPPPVETILDILNADETLTLEKFKEQVTIIVTPEREPQPHPSGKGGIAGDTPFWLHTVGMNKFDHPELEIREVPAFYTPEAFRTLNHWGHYAVTEKPLSPDENIMTVQTVPLVLRTTLSPDPFWGERDLTCLRIHCEAVLFECGGHHDGDTIH